jgi:RNA polymerase sigma factor (sigma-70 family)
MSGTPKTPEHLLLPQLERIGRIVAAICRRNGVAADEAEEFASLVNLKLVEDDYATLRKFQGRSTLETYLTVVIANLFRDYRVQKWGRWRASAAAREGGAVAVQLESLIYRDGLGFEQAVRVLRSRLPVAQTDGELARLAARLPVRSNPRKGHREPSELLEAAERADGRVVAAEADRLRDSARAALENALGTLPPEDQVVFRLRYWEGMTVADIARTLQLEQKPLYRRIESGLERLRRELEAHDVDRDLAMSLLDDAD